MVSAVTGQPIRSHATHPGIGWLAGPGLLVPIHAGHQFRGQRLVVHLVSMGHDGTFDGVTSDPGGRGWGGRL